MISGSKDPLRQSDKSVDVTKPAFNARQVDRFLDTPEHLVFALPAADEPLIRLLSGFRPQVDDPPDDLFARRKSLKPRRGDVPGSQPATAMLLGLFFAKQAQR